MQSPDATPPPTPAAPEPAGGAHESRFSFDRNVAALKRRLAQEATAAVGMLEAALDSMWKLDAAAAREVRRRDDTIDREEVEIEQECLKLLALHQPFARDFRIITFVLKVNADIERAADHACSIAKVAGRLAPGGAVRWPTALQEMGQRVPAMCHSLLRAVLDENVELAQQIVSEDDIIDELEKRLFEEVEEMMERDPEHRRAGLLIYRAGRELERVGDLMKNIGEDIIYLATGSIVRHEQKRAAAKP